MSNSVPNHVSQAEDTRQQLKKWCRKANELGIFEDVASALMMIEGKLRFEPLTWGDPLFDLKKLGMTLRRGVHEYILVEYGVNEMARVVFVRKYQLLPWAPFQVE